MKIELPKRVDAVLTNVIGEYRCGRVVYETLEIGSRRIYLCGTYGEGCFAAWNEIKEFNQTDIQYFGCLNDAWDFVTNAFCV